MPVTATLVADAPAVAEVGLIELTVGTGFATVPVITILSIRMVPPELPAEYAIAMVMAPVQDVKFVKSAVTAPKEPLPVPLVTVAVFVPQPAVAAVIAKAEGPVPLRLAENAILVILTEEPGLVNVSVKVWAADVSVADKALPETPPKLVHPAGEVVQSELPKPALITVGWAKVAQTPPVPLSKPMV